MKVYVYTDDSDGHSTLREVKGAKTIKEAKEIFEVEQIKEAEESAGEDDLKGQLKVILDHETHWHSVTFLEAGLTSDFDMREFKERTAADLKKRIQADEDSKERQEYERLKKKYAK
jgi:hypothetical protein